MTTDFRALCDELINELQYRVAKEDKKLTYPGYYSQAQQLIDRTRAALLQPPQPVAVSERLPGPDDCVPHPRTNLGSWCWGFERCEVSLARPARWRLMHMETVELEASHWLGGKDLPLPAAPEAES